jgi:hypothetical protein
MSIPIIIVFVFIFIIIIVLFLYGKKKIVNKENKYQNNPQANKIRVAVLLPFTIEKESLTDTYRSAIKDDCNEQLQGVFKFLKHDIGQQCFDDNTFEFVFRNHKNDSAVAEHIVEKEIKMGTKYFFSTMSQVNVALSEFFNGEKIDKTNDPILICTATSSSNISTKPNKVYRYYPRGIEEGFVLGQTVKNKSGFSNIQNIISIVIDSNYGDSISKAFKDEVIQVDKYQYKKTIKIDFSTDSCEINTQIQYLNIDKTFAILICHYGQGITDIMNALNTIVFQHNDKEDLPIIMFSSTLKSENWQKSIQHILDKVKYCIAIPKYNTDNSGKKHKNVITDFSEFAFTKLIKTIQAKNKNASKDFHQIWKEEKVPPNLTVEYITEGSTNENGDTKIEMDVEMCNF